jgi:hypothetical protein
MGEILELRQLVAALVGAILALSGQSLLHRGTRAHGARRLAVAFWEELSAVYFYGSDTRDGSPNFAGFSSQTFDSLFRDVAESLPQSLTRDLMRYHWRMKYLEEIKPVSIPSSGGVNRQFWREAKELRARLLQRLKHYGEHRDERLVRSKTRSLTRRLAWCTFAPAA